MSKKVTINPVTRLEGHGKIEIFLDDKGNVEDAYFQVVELRGFERFCIGRPAEEMPRIVPNICGVCPTPHNMASTKALDDLYSVEPTPTAKLIRQLHYNAFYVEDHYVHFSSWLPRISCSVRMPTLQLGTSSAWSRRWAWTSAAR